MQFATNLWCHKKSSLLPSWSHSKYISRNPAGSYDKATRTAICFEHKAQYHLIRAPYTRIVVFWHISNILLYNRQLVFITHELIYGVRAAIRQGKNYCETGLLSSPAERGWPGRHEFNYNGCVSWNMRIMEHLMSWSILAFVGSFCQIKAIRCDTNEGINMSLKSLIITGKFLLIFMRLSTSRIDIHHTGSPSHIHSFLGSFSNMAGAIRVQLWRPCLIKMRIRTSWVYVYGIWQYKVLSIKKLLQSKIIWEEKQWENLGNE